MVQAIQASKIEEVGELVDLFGLEKQLDPVFFPEWQRDLPELNSAAQKLTSLVSCGDRLLVLSQIKFDCYSTNGASWEE